MPCCRWLHPIVAFDREMCDRAIAKCAIGRSPNVRSGDRQMCDRANSSCNSVNFTPYPKLGHGRNSDTAVPFPYELGGGYMRLCAKKFGHGSAVSRKIGWW
ncbi:hypothetical protein Q5692_22920 [Microcoleus sp. C2C3]|uniref:hypothetical protein n=1 Tax=unclassified Microcoleus TaxID=2642155 RepID=UPI002FD34ECE